MPKKRAALTKKSAQEIRRLLAALPPGAKVTGLALDETGAVPELVVSFQP